jgi:hypothetical protein
VIDRGVIDLLARSDVVDLGLVAEAISTSSPELLDRVRLDDLLALSRRLPTGLIHAESIWALESRPSDLSPLALGSAWSAMERSLVVEVPALGGDLTAILIDLGRYRLAASVVRARLADHPDLIEALAGELTPALSTRLAMLLEAPVADIEALDRRAPHLRSDLAWMARMEFSPPVHLHDDVRPDRLAERGARIANDLLARLPAGDFWVLLADHAAAIELISPYVRDLGHALFRWGLENSDRLRTFGLVEALEAKEEAPDVDLAALVVPDLFHATPDLLEERRTNEATQGLELEDRNGTIFGWADLGRLAAPDRAALPEGINGTLAIVCGGAPEALIAASRTLIASGRVAGLAQVLMAEVRADIVVAQMLATADDGFQLAGAPLLIDKANELGIAVHPVDTLEDPPDLLVKLLRVVRRARVRNELSDSAMIFTLMTPNLPESATPTLKGRLAALHAARLVLATMTSAPSSRDRTLVAKSATPGQKPSFQRRFRA